ncbi:hypothetical protein C8J56DRAFT_923193 [Mycena floridula]|nr:hypothetical protein C8J56DRAFT_923193 [Mycena floridula]
MPLDALRSFQLLSQLHATKMSCDSPAILFIIKRLKKQALWQYSRAIPHNIDGNDQLVIFSIHGADLSQNLKENYTRKEILLWTHVMLREIRCGHRAAKDNISEFLSARTSLILLLRVLAYTNPPTEKTSTYSLRPTSIDRLLLYFCVHRCNNDCASRSQSLQLILHNLIESMDTFADTMDEWKLVEQELKDFQQELIMEKTPLCEVQVPLRWASMGEKCRSQASKLRNLQDLNWSVFKRFQGSGVVKSLLSVY